MSHGPLIHVDDLAAHVNDPGWALIDCRFTLTDTGRGRRDYLAGHISGAVYAHLDDDLSSPIIPGKTGRHPLPDIEEFSAALSGWGVGPDVQVVAYDDSGGAMASRLWWLLRWLSHDAVAVLDGGWPAWLLAEYPVTDDTPSPIHREFRASPRSQLVVSAHEVMKLTDDRSGCLIDAREAPRYRGEQEPIDPVAGRIPGAVNFPHLETVGSDGLYLPRDELRQRFETLLAGCPPEDAIFYCGSGVTAARNLLALAHAGLGDARLYAGSWSEWITDSSRPVEKG